MKLNYKRGGLLLAFVTALSFFSTSAWAQEEGLTASESAAQVDLEPPPVPGTWSGSAMSLLYMEDGDLIPAYRQPWSGSFFNWASVNMRDFREGEGQLSTYNYVSADYRLSPDSKIAIRPEFSIKGAGRNFYGDVEQGSVSLGDIYLQYSRHNLGLLHTPAGDVGASGSFRVYFPNSEFAKRQRLMTKVQGRVILQMPMGYGFWLSYHFRPTYFVQRQKSYETEFFNVRANENYRLEQRLELSKLIGGRWGIHQEVSLEHRWFYGSASNQISPRTDGYLSLSTAASVAVGKVSFKGGVSYESKVADPERSSDLYHESDTTYFLMTNVRL